MKDLDKTQVILAISSSNLSDAKKRYYIQEIKNIPVTAADTVAKKANITTTSLLAAVTDKLSAAWAKLTAFMSANPLILLGTVAVGLIGTVYGLAKAYEHFTVSLDEAKEATYDAVENYQEITSEIESVESKLKDLNAQINDLDPITDADQISALKEESAELERQLTILEEKQRLAKEAANTAAQQSLGMTTESKYQGTKTYTFNTSTMQGGEVLRGDKVTQEQELKNAMNAYDEYAENRKDIHEEMARLSKEEKGDTQEFKQKQKEYDDLTQKMQDARTHANELTIAIEEQMAGLSLDSDASREIYAKNKAALDWNSAWLEAIETGKELTEVEKQIHGLNSYFDGSTTKNAIRDKLLDVAKTKGKNADLVDELAKMGLTLEDIGLAAEYGEEALAEYFGSIIDAANEASNATKNIVTTVSEVESAFESANQGANWNTMSDFISQAKDLFDDGKIGTDDFQSVVKWFSPEEIDTTGYDVPAEAYADAWEKSYKKIKRWFDQENPLDSMWNFVDDLEAKSLASVDGNKIDFKFESTAEAAKELGVSLDVIDTLMHNLEEYGLPIDNIKLSGELLSDYEDGLNGIKDIYDELDDGIGKDRFKNLIEGDDFFEGFDKEYAVISDELGQLTEDKVIRIQFEYSLAQLQQEIDELQRLANEGDNTAKASLNVKKSQRLDLLEKQTGYSEESVGVDDGYAKATNKITELQQKMKTVNEEQKVIIQDQISAIYDMQFAFQDALSKNPDLNWNEFLKTEDFGKAITLISESTGMTKDDIVALFGMNLNNIKIPVEFIPNYSQIQEKVDNLNLCSYIDFQANVDGVEREIRAHKDFEGNIYYTADIDGVTYALEGVEQSDGTVIFSPVTDDVDAYIADNDGGEKITRFSPDTTETDKEVAKTDGGNRWVKFLADVSELRSKLSSAVNSVLSNIKIAFGGSNFEGTVENSGKAFASGTIKNPEDIEHLGKTTKNEKALTGEVGQEMVVHGNRWWTVGDNGAEFADIPKDSVVFNAEQTKKLLNNGHINSRGKAYKEGTAYYDVSLPSRGTSSGGSSKTKTSSSKSSSSSNSDSSKDTEQEFDWIERAIKKVQRTIDNLSKTVAATYKKWTTRNSALKDQISAINSEISLQQKAYDYYMKKASSLGLSSTYVNKIKDGTISIETLTNESLIKKIQEYQELYDKALEAKDAITDLKDEIASLAKEKFDNISTEYEDKLSIIEHEIEMIEASIDMAESRGYVVSKKYYEELIKQEQSNISTLTQQYNTLKANLESDLKLGNIEQYSEDWYEMVNAVLDVESAIKDANSALIEYQNSMRDLEWEIFDKIQELYSNIHAETDFYIDLMSNKKLVDEDGAFTDQGQATLGLHAVNFNSYMAQADKYAKEITDINAKLAKDPNNQTLLDRRIELEEAQRDLISSAEDEKQAIKSLYEEGYNGLLDSLSELIDKRKELLNSQKD